MNEKTTILIKTDKKVKVAAQKVAKELGIPLSTIINSHLRTLVREKRFVAEVPLVPNARTRKILDEGLRDIREGKNIHHFDTVEDLLASLTQDVA